MARAELERSRDRYAELFDFAPTPFLTLDMPGMVTGSILATAQLLGTPRARIDETPLVRWVVPDGQRTFLDPDGTGLELMVELRKRGPVRGVAMTGFGTEGDARSRHAGFERHLVKPVSGLEITRAVEEIGRSSS
ncbi:MAG TPA: hypothetical protein VMR50_01950 [Myxococcota bacterium]|nr:hypothetical protein [Myxococcota bacterium]